MNRLFFSLFTLLFIGCLVSFYCSLSFPESQFNFVGENKRAELISGKSVTQVFLTQANNLERIKVAIDDNSLWFGETLKAEILDEHCQQSIRKTTLHSLLFKTQGEFVLFDFAPIENSQGKLFCVKITYTSPYAGRKDRPAVKTIDGPFTQGLYYTDFGKNKTYENRSLQLRLSYGKDTLLDKFHTLEERLSQYKPLLFKGYVLWFGIIGTLLSLTFFYLFSKIEDKEV